MASQTVEITLTGAGLQETQGLDIRVSITALVKIEAKAAKRRATAWLVSEVGNMLVGGTPHLVISRERTIWRVPALLTSSQSGVIGEVGLVDVEAETGALLVSETLREQLLANVNRAIRSTPASVS